MKKTWLLGFGFFSISITWSLYNAFVPLFLERFLTSTALIGFMMTIDNYFALFLQPWIGRRSDRTNTRFGRRMPYLLIGMPLAALFVALVPFHNSLLLLVLLMMAMNLSMSLFRSPTISLMPDITPEAQRTKANGIINFMGGIGAILAFGAGSMLYRADPSFPFIASAFVILFAMFILQRSIKERRDTLSYTISEKQDLNFKGQLDRTTIFLLLAIFFWFVGYQGVEALFTLYGTNQLGMDDADAGFSLTFFSLAFVIFAIPSGWMGAKLGKKKVILAGVVGLALVFLAINWVETMVMLRILLLIGGAFWACININSYPFIVSTGTDAAIGTRTGLYYLVSSLAAITSPPLLGLLIDLFGYSILFYCASAAMGFALVCLLMIKHNGESTSAQPSIGLSDK